MTTRATLDIYYEHPDWHRPLFAELDRRGVPFTRQPAGAAFFTPSEPARGPRIVLNRMSPSAHTRGGSHLIFYTTQYLSHLERLGTRVINGTNAWRTEISKAWQLALLERLGLPSPVSRVIHSAAQAADAAEGLRFPVLVKPNIGGSGAGIARFDTPAALADASRSVSIDLGLDHTALVQEVVPADEGRIVRVEVLNGTFLYAIRVYTPGDRFNLCPADGCETLRVEGWTPPPEVIRAVERITAASGIEVGGVEYMIDARTGTPVYYDVNAMSNFIADAPRVIGFDPFVNLVDWLETELEQAGRLDGQPALDGRLGDTRRVV